MSLEKKIGKILTGIGIATVVLIGSPVNAQSQCPPYGLPFPDANVRAGPLSILGSRTPQPQPIRLPLPRGYELQYHPEHYKPSQGWHSNIRFGETGTRLKSYHIPSGIMVDIPVLYPMPIFPLYNLYDFERRQLRPLPYMIQPP